jgi:hypothetical protein
MIVGNIVCMIVTIRQFVVVWSGARLLFTTGLPDTSV